MLYISFNHIFLTPQIDLNLKIKLNKKYPLTLDLCDSKHQIFHFL